MYFASSLCESGKDLVLHAFVCFVLRESKRPRVAYIFCVLVIVVNVLVKSSAYFLFHIYGPRDRRIYGYRPRVHPWKLLSPYEFVRYWDAQPLLVPSHYQNLGVRSRTKWTHLGNELQRTTEYKEGKLVAKPGKHYVAVLRKALGPAINVFYRGGMRRACHLGEAHRSWVGC